VAEALIVPKMRLEAALGAAPDAANRALAVVLHLRARYVSKAAIFKDRCCLCPLKIEVPLEFQGLGSLGAAHSGDGFSLANLTPIKERVSGC
jgi:hypothetical protein